MNRNRNARQNGTSHGTIRGKGTFTDPNSRWSSQQARVTFTVKIEQRGGSERVMVRASKFWGQQCESSPGAYRKPHFKSEEWRRMKQVAVNRARDRLAGPTCTTDAPEGGLHCRWPPRKGGPQPANF